ncbi:magnesium transporter MRS2-I-like [Cicer arietinum]|uniref:magnesium transporter MRS2-I-like n=1 Tax=Cicer arietinum TaxID=3827 RepID=UPI003CC6A398
MAEGTLKSILRKTSFSPTNNWIKLDGNGHSSILDIDKYEIMRLVRIDARDLRIVDPLLAYPSTILSREEVIVLNLEHIKAIITAKEVFLQDPTSKDVAPIVKELQRKLFTTGTNERDVQDNGPLDVQVDEEDGNAESPFEFRALEIFLEAICSFLDARVGELEIDTYPTLDELTKKVSSRNLDKVRKLKSAMTRLTARVQKVKEEIEHLMDDDEDMADLYLSRKLVDASSSPISESVAGNWFASSPTIKSKSVATFHRDDENNVDELEMLLEAYFMQIDDTLNRLTTLRGYIDDTEDYINIHIDNHRNQLIQLELLLNAGELSLAVYAVVTGILGMNLPFSWTKDHDYMFKWVVIFTGVFTFFLFLIIVAYARKKGLVGS